jgi:hypothetical protein
MEAVTETDRMTKRYGSARGINGFSLSVEVNGLLGPGAVSWMEVNRGVR